MRLKEIMTSPVETIEVHESAEHAWERMRDDRIRHLVVTWGLGRYLSAAEAETLPRMLLNGDPRLPLIAQSTGGVLIEVVGRVGGT